MTQKKTPNCIRVCFVYPWLRVEAGVVMLVVSTGSGICQRWFLVGISRRFRNQICPYFILLECECTEVTEPFDTTVNFHDIGADGKVQQAPAPQYVSQEPNKDRLGQTHTTLVREMVPSSSTQQGKTLFPRYAFVYFLVARVAQTGGRERCTCLSLQQRQKILTIT
jgi:hypothetical protein